MKLQFLETYQVLINKTLTELLPSEECFPQTIHQSMRYSLLAGGKRIRGILTLLSAELFEVEQHTALKLAVAIECAHTYSLIHDDLPAMDDDDFRRGKPTSHKVFGEGIAILTGDALLTLAFQLIAELPVNTSITVCLLRDFARVMGSQGMIGGQIVDIESEGHDIDIPILQYIHTHKTGELINFSILAGAMLSDQATPRYLKALSEYGERLGLAFQVMDDILDHTGTLDQLGKEAGQDKVHNKVTYLSRYGLEDSKKQMLELIAQAKQALSIFGAAAEKHKQIADYFSQRIN